MGCKQNYFPVFIFLLLSIVSINPNQLTPQIITNVFVLYSIYKLLDTYRKENVLSQLFEAAFWLGISGYITISSIISFPLFFIVLLILRPFYWRDWAIAILGFIAPIFICESIAYLSDYSQWYLFKSVAVFLQFLKPPSLSEYFLPLTTFLVITLLFAIFQNLVRGFGNTVKKQKAKREKVHDVVEDVTCARRRQDVLKNVHDVVKKWQDVTIARSCRGREATNV